MTWSLSAVVKIALRDHRGVHRALVTGYRAARRLAPTRPNRRRRTPAASRTARPGARGHQPPVRTVAAVDGARSPCRVPCSGRPRPHVAAPPVWSPAAAHSAGKLPRPPCAARGRPTPPGVRPMPVGRSAGPDPAGSVAGAVRSGRRRRCRQVDLPGDGGPVRPPIASCAAAVTVI
jgi:hypothetical protein